MLLKLKTFNETLGKGWVYLDKIEKIEKFPVAPQGPTKPGGLTDAYMAIYNTPGSQDGDGEVSYDQMNFFVYKKGEECLRIFTELPAFLLNEEGKTIERIN